MEVWQTEMPKHQRETVNVPPPGCWSWNDDAQTLEFVSYDATAEDALKKRRKTKVNFNDLTQQSDRLAQLSTLDDRGRQNIRKPIGPSAPSVKQMQGAHVTIDNVKQVAVTLLQENHSSPIPLCFIAVLKSKELDGFLGVLLLYISCYMEHKCLENKSKSLMIEPSIRECQVMAVALAKVELAQMKLAVCYANLVMGLGMAQHHHMACGKGRVSVTHRDYQLYKCLYSFFCYAAWVTFGRKDLRDIQEEVGRLLYSNTFNPALKNRTDEDLTAATPALDGSGMSGGADPQEQETSHIKHRGSHRRPALSSILTQRSPLMVSLLPLPKEQSPHLFLRRPRKQSLLEPNFPDTKALMEELDQQLANARFGILGKSLRLFSATTLTRLREKKKDWDEDSENKDGEDRNYDSSIHVRGSTASFTRPKSTAVDRHGSRVDTGICRATTKAVSSDAK